ncbi:MAG: 16S rRNA (cytosine967-C5)-methyltransferase [Parasphingorhabdus sp.]|jgi:16S rRNA (cytosine967-C5)-methyltransferase
MSSPRAVAAQVVLDVCKFGQSLDNAYQQRAENLTDRDRALIKEISYGTIRHYFALQKLANQLLKQPLKKKEADLNSILLSGLYQIFYTGQAPYAIVNETAGLCRTVGKKWATSLINAVLRRSLREQNKLKEIFLSHSPDNYPTWLSSIVASDWPTMYEQILDAGNKKPPMWIRVNEAKISPDDFTGLLEKANLSFERSILAGAIRLIEPQNVDNIPGFSDGYCSIQDISAQLAGHAAPLSTSDRILDGCSAPGGKLSHLLERSSDTSEFHAVDVPARVTLIENNLQRLGFTATLHRGELGSFKLDNFGKLFTLALLDAPCSGSGVIRRHPDIKLLRKDFDQAHFSQRQLGLLEHIWQLIERSGHVLYTTCSVLRTENEQVIDQFLQISPDAEEILLPESFGHSCSYGRQRLPGEDNGDGFYYCLLRKQ